MQGSCDPVPPRPANGSDHRWPRSAVVRPPSGCSCESGAGGPAGFTWLCLWVQSARRALHPKAPAQLGPASAVVSASASPMLPKTNFAHNRTLPSPSVTFPSELMQPWSKLGPINCEGWVICLFEQSPVPEDSFGVYRSILFKLSGEAAIKRLRSGLLENLLPR